MRIGETTQHPKRKREEGEKGFGIPGEKRDKEREWKGLVWDSP